MTEHSCLACDAPFPPTKRSHAKFCDQRCGKAWQRRNLEPRPRPECVVDGCSVGSAYGSTGMCRSHRRRAQLYGDPLGVPAARPDTTAERFWSKVDRRGPDECWPWLGARTPRGYGHFNAGKAYRVSYELNKGPIPEGLEIDHTCRNTSCVNPAHLDAVTHQENIRRSIAAGGRLRELCKAGLHPMTEENLYVTRGGKGRRCRPCTLAAQAVVRAARRAQEAESAA